jgi:DNA-binding MarR family transcriptional regulator
VVAHFILKDRSAMVKLLDQLTRAGLIEQKVSAAERRAHELYLTPKGRALARKVRAIAIEQSEGFFSVLSEDERASLLTILRKLYRHHIADASA